MILPFQSDSDVTAAIPQVERHLSTGGVLAYPTETVYGLGSAATDTGLDRLAAMKGRPPRKPFLLLVSSTAMVEQIGLSLNQSARVLAAEFWPGPLTLVLPGGEGRLPDRLRGAEGGIAVRWTSHRAIARLVTAMNRPLTSTSANLPGGPPAPGSERIVELFPEAVANGTLLVLDGGVLGNVPPSTLVDCTGPLPRLVREGAIPRSELRRRAGSMAP
ncbi:MAG: L-threonylcarbamoyladenylate synthase [Gemmatimonadales bacterium]